MTPCPAFPRLARALALAVLAALPLASCETKILDVDEPDIVLNPNSPDGAVGLRNGVVLRLAQAVNGVQGPDALFVYGGLLTDEWRSGDTFVQRNNQDQRIFDPANTFNVGPFRALNRVRTEAQAAITAIRTYLPVNTTGLDSTFMVGQMFAFTAYVETLLGEHYCNGIPVSTVSGSDIVFGNPISDDSMFGLAMANADSALANYKGRDSVRVKSLALVVKARALLDRGQYAAAAALVPSTAVATTFRYDVTHSTTVNSNQVWALNTNAKRYTMVDAEGTVGLNYISTNDPRLPRATGTNPNTDYIFDSAFPLFVTRQGIWGQTSSIPIATGIEARLIEAEAQLQAGNNAGWLATINTLRTNTALYPTPQAGFTRGPNLTALTDPGTPTARQNIMFRERAFAMFSTGHRLGDMRRLVRTPGPTGGYGQAVNSVYPNGNFFKGGTYGTALMLAIPFDEVNNPNFVQCTDQNP